MPFSSFVVLFCNPGECHQIPRLGVHPFGIVVLMLDLMWLSSPSAAQAYRKLIVGSDYVLTTAESRTGEEAIRYAKASKLCDISSHRHPE